MEAEKKSKLEFSKELGIPRSTFQGYLKGENCLRSDSIEEIAKGLNITPAQLISGPEDAAAESLRLETLLPQIPALHPQAQRLAKDAIALFADRLPRLAGADVHRCARLRAGCSGGRLPIFSAGDLAAGAHALLLRSSWPAAAKRLLDNACGHLSLFPTTAPPSSVWPGSAPPSSSTPSTCSTSSTTSSTRKPRPCKRHRSSAASFRRNSYRPRCKMPSSSIQGFMEDLLMMIFLKKISRVFQRPKLCLHFGRVAHVQGRLDIVFLCAPIDNKIDLALFSGLFFSTVSEISTTPTSTE